MNVKRNHPLLFNPLFLKAVDPVLYLSQLLQKSGFPVLATDDCTVNESFRIRTEEWSYYKWNKFTLLANTKVFINEHVHIEKCLPFENQFVF